MNHLATDSNRSDWEKLRNLYIPEIALVRDVARHLCSSRSTVRRLIRDGVIPAKKLGGRWYIARRELLGLFARPSSETATLLSVIGGARKEKLSRGRTQFRIVDGGEEETT